LIDLPSTLINLAGIKKPKQWEGINFLKERRDFVYFESYHNKNRFVIDNFSKDKKKYFFGGIRTKKFKYVQDDIEGELLFLAGKEYKNLINEKRYSKEKENLKKLFKNFIDKYKKDYKKEKMENLKDEQMLKERLKKLGYI